MVQADVSKAEDAQKLIAAAEEKIEGEMMREVIAVLSDDEMEGRLPGTAGDAASQAYIESRLERAGFAPGGIDGSYVQPFTLVGATTRLGPRMRPATFSAQRCEMVCNVLPRPMSSANTPPTPFARKCCKKLRPTR